MRCSRIKFKTSWLGILPFLIVMACSKQIHRKERLELPQGQKFAVAEVSVADSLLSEYPIEQVLERALGKKIWSFPAAQKELALVPLLGSNLLLSTVHRCFAEHRPLVLSPDVIWMAICQGASIHINEHFEELKDSLFIGDKPQIIEMPINNLDWSDFIDTLSQQTRVYTQKDLYHFFVADFSTTDEVAKTAYQIALLESQSKAFSYVAISKCGIPSICITGTPSDWQNILKKLVFLKKIGLHHWADCLKPIIKEFIAASQGKTNIDFWKSIYKDFESYSGTFISGWIIKFFPYIKTKEPTEKSIEAMLENGNFSATERYIPNPYLEGSCYLKSTLTSANIPSGLSTANILLKNTLSEKDLDLEIKAGFFACRQYKDKSLEPFISWAVAEKDAPKTKIPAISNAFSPKPNPQVYWSPYTVDKLVTPAVYNKKTFQTQEQGNAFLRRLVLDSLKQQTPFQQLSFQYDTLNIEVLQDGHVGNVYISRHKEDAALNAYLKGIFDNLPDKWTAAKAKYSAAGYMFQRKDDPILNVNSLVWIKL